MSYYYEVYIPNETEPRIYSAVRKLRGLPEGTTIWRASEDDRYPVPVANGKAVVPSKRRANKACSGFAYRLGKIGLCGTIRKPLTLAVGQTRAKHRLFYNQRYLLRRFSRIAETTTARVH